MGCFNDRVGKFVCGGGGVVADTNYLYPARWRWININCFEQISCNNNL